MILALFALVAVTLAEKAEQASAAAPEETKGAAPEGKDLETANSFIYGYPGYYGYGG